MGDVVHGKDQALAIVNALCSVSVDRRPGSVGNDQAVEFVSHALRNAGWQVSTPEFDCLDWTAGEACLQLDEEEISISPSPYGLGVDTTGPLRVLSTIEDIRSEGIAGCVAVVTGDLAAEPITPKAFPFYGSEEHAAIIEAFELAGPAAVIAVTGKYPELCGALDPFPLFEDGDFGIPTASIRPVGARRLLLSDRHWARVRIDAQRLPSKARNVIARSGPEGPRLTVCAHIDTKPGTPGAVDNATGVAALLLIADLLTKHGNLPIGVELLIVNGEDHFAAPGEIAWLQDNADGLDDIALFVNIDGAGYRRGRTAYSFYNVDESVVSTARDTFSAFEDLMEGPAWFQSDHAIFAMQGRPALAFTTEFVQEMLEQLFHSDQDTIEQVDPARIVNLAHALTNLIAGWHGN